jgi:3-oxoacyl-[acyl-carrier-protein] synthase-3
VVPKATYSNAELGPHADKAAKMTGVLSRRRAVPKGLLPGQVGIVGSTERYGVSAAKLLLKELELNPGQVDRLVFVTQTPCRQVPSGAHLLHESLGLREDCPPTEVNWSCAGYVHGLWLAATLGAASHDVCRTLLVVGDMSSQLTDLNDQATGPLFGDAVSATLVESGQGVSPRMSVCLSSAMDVMGGLYKAHDRPLVMDGPEVAAMVLSRVPPLVREALAFSLAGGLPPPSAFAFHQANAFLLGQMYRKLHLEAYGTDCAPSNIAKYGNCSSASIPLLLCDTEAWKGAERHGLVAMVGFGAGWSAGVAMADLRETSVLLLAEED